MHMEHTYTPHVNTYSEAQRLQTDTLSTHMNTASVASYCFLLWLSKREICQRLHVQRYKYKANPCGRWAQTLYLPTVCLWIQVSAVAGTWMYKMPWLQPLPVQADSLMRTHTTQTYKCTYGHLHTQG